MRRQEWTCWVSRSGLHPDLSSLQCPAAVQLPLQAGDRDTSILRRFVSVA